MQFHLKVLGWDFAEIVNVANRTLVAAAASLVWLALILAVVSPQRAFAQTTSTIVGTVSDPQGLLLPGATVKVTSETLGVVMETTSDSMGNYSIVGLPAGIYTFEASHSGFATRRFEKLELLLNRTLVMNVTLPVGTLQQNVTVTAEVPLLQTNDATSAATVVPKQIEDMPLNGRNYLDLMQLVPGVTINQQADQGSDTAAPILGERGGNAIFLIDGMSNRNEVDGGAAAQFNQDTIYEFEVLTTGFKAEFGHGSGGIVNVLTKSGGDSWHGSGFMFHRNQVFDSSDVPNTEVPALLRYDYGATVGGPLVKRRVFFFGSAERIQEDRHLNFVFPPGIPQVLQDFEQSINKDSLTHNTRVFAKLDEHMGRHSISEEINLTNNHVTEFLPLSMGLSLPSTRTDIDGRTLMLGLRDTAFFGNANNPWVLTFHMQYRDEPTLVRGTHPEAGIARTVFNIFTGYDQGTIFGDLGSVTFGAGITPSTVVSKFLSPGAALARTFGKHDLKFGADFMNMRIDGVEVNNLYNQLFATIPDYINYGPIGSWYTLRRFAGATPEDNMIHLRNNYLGPFIQDDWKIRKNLTLNLGLRWDYDSRFPATTNFSPRLGAAWSPTPNWVIRGSFGMFYDHFRMGLARDVPAFGGANIFFTQDFTYPRLFYGSPSVAPILEGLCLSGQLTDAEIAAQNLTCPWGQPLPFFGVDHLNGVVAPGHAPIPANSIVTMQNVQSLTGLTPQQYADQASIAVGYQPGFFFWRGFDELSQKFQVDSTFPIVVDKSFKTPFTRTFNVGVQRQLGKDWMLSADYYHKDIRNILGIRRSNLAFEARLPGHLDQLQPGTGDVPLNSFGPWNSGTYNALITTFKGRVGRWFGLQGNYTYTHAIDDALCSNFVSNALAGTGFYCWPSDSFIGVPPIVTDPVTGQTNANGFFTASNGTPIWQAGKFHNGPSFDMGPSDMALNHTFLISGTATLPWKFQVSTIFRVQSGFHFGQQALILLDCDGDGYYNSVDHPTGRNHYQAPHFLNDDIRISKVFQHGEHVKVTMLFEFFNLFNNGNPAAVQNRIDVPAIPFNSALQVLPGREGQLAIRFEF